MFLNAYSNVTYFNKLLETKNVQQWDVWGNYYNKINFLKQCITSTDL